MPVRITLRPLQDIISLLQLKAQPAYAHVPVNDLPSAQDLWHQYWGSQTSITTTEEYSPPVEDPDGSAPKPSPMELKILKSHPFIRSVDRVLVREEYTEALEAVEKHFGNIHTTAEMIIIGHPGIGE